MNQIEIWATFMFLLFIAVGVHDISKDVKAIRKKIEAQK
jgi:hypothetical protein